MKTRRDITARIPRALRSQLLVQSTQHKARGSKPMEMFDQVYVDCPECNHEVEFQSKAHDCTLGTYDLNSAPNEIKADLIGQIG